MSNKKNNVFNNFIFETETNITNDNQTIYTTIDSSNLNDNKRILNKNQSINSSPDTNLTNSCENKNENENDYSSDLESKSDLEQTELSNIYNLNNSTDSGSDSDLCSNSNSNSTDSNIEYDNIPESSKKSNNNLMITETDYNTEYQDKIYDKYMKNTIKTYKFTEEIKDILKKNQNQFDMGIIKNNLDEIKKSIDNGNTIFKNLNGHIIKICSNNECAKLTCGKECYKNNFYRSFKNFNRGIKTIYNVLFKLILSNPIFRNQCKCCENKKYLNYFQELDKNFNLDKKIAENIDNEFEPTKILELQINFLINKFMGTIGILDCECKFKGKYYGFYSHDYLNFSSIIKIYTKTIPIVIKLLKTYYKIKDNHEELMLIDDSRCIHEDIRFNNLTYCVKKKYHQIGKSNMLELVMGLDLVNDWVIESIKITILLLNQQSFEHFMYCFESKSKKIDLLFSKIYQSNNELLDLNYISNKNSVITIINDNYKKISNDKIEKIIELVVRQLTYRNKFILNYEVNNVLVNFILECLKRNNNVLGFKWLKFMKNFKTTDNELGLEHIFNDLLNNSTMSVENKISYLKIISKNKINLIEYDFVNKLIDIDIGDKIILEFNKEENTLFNIKDYKNENYIVSIIKKCIANNKTNILDYVLFNLDTSIRNFLIDSISIYLLNIPKKTSTLYDYEYKYINLLKVILKYFVQYKYDIKIISSLSEKKLTPVEYCIEFGLNLSAKIFITNNIGINSNKKDFNLLIKCMEKNNPIIAEYLILNNPSIIYYSNNNLNIFTYLFNCYNKNIISDTNSLLIFLYKFLNSIIYNECVSDIINYQDESNELVCFKILNSNLSSGDKVLIFRLIEEYANPLEINNYNQENKTIVNTFNYPLIIHSMLLDELEITFIFLNNLIKKGHIKKNTKINEYRIFDYYIANTKVNINFIPIIFKYVKDNSHKKNKFDNDFSINKKFILPNVQNALYIIIIVIGFIIFFVKYKFKLNQTNNFINQTDTDRKLNQADNNNKYVEITISSDNNTNILNTLTPNDKIIISSKNNKNNNIGNKNNRNIWLQSSQKSKSSTININHKFKNLSNESDESKSDVSKSDVSKSDVSKSDVSESDVSESDILFGYG